MFHRFNFNNPVEAHDQICERLVFGDRPYQDYDWVHGTEVGLHNIGIHCKTIDFDYDLKKIWVLPGRWRKMVRDYINPNDYQDTLAMIDDRLTGPIRNARGIALMRTNKIQGKGTGRNVRRRWGSCMISLSFRRTPVPTVSLHSRTTYFGYLALMDMAVARTFAAECAERCGISLADIEFVWTLELAQFHGFRSLAWMLGDPEIKQEMDEELPNRLKISNRFLDGGQIGFRKALDGYERIVKSDQAGILYGDERFASFCRIRRRFHTEVMGEEYASQFSGGEVPHPRTGLIRIIKPFAPLESLWVRDLNFSALNAPTSETDDEEDEEDEE